MAYRTLGFSGGLVTAADPSALSQDELQTATGAYYKPGDTDRCWKINGRGTFGDTGSAAIVKGVQLIQYDSGGTDRVIALSGTKLYSATPGVTGTFSELVTGLSASADHLSCAHSNDRWYVCNGVDGNKVIESDGTVLSHGMQAPVALPTGVAAAAASSATYPTAVTNGTPAWVDTANAYDTGAAAGGTYAYATASTVSTTTCAWRAWGSSTSSNRTLYVKYQIIQTPSHMDPVPISKRWGSRTAPKATNAYFQVDYSTDDGTNWSGLASGYLADVGSEINTVSIPVSVNSNLLQVRCYIQYLQGTNIVTMRVYDIQVNTGGFNANFSTTTGIYYGVTEYDMSRGWESAAIYSALVTLSTQNKVTLTLPSTAKNSNATHWRIYRTTDGGTLPAGLGYLADVPIAQSTFIDPFSVSTSIQLAPLYPLLQISYESETQYYAYNVPPPILSAIANFKGHMIGLSDTKPRALFYTPADDPNSWPDIYVNEKFPLPQHDSLVAVADIGDVLLIAAQEAVFRITDLPEVILGSFEGASVSVLAGQPGCVGRKAMCSYSLGGEPRAAWVSPYGIHETNGTMSRNITSDLNWSSTVNVATLSTAVLRYDPLNRLLIFAYDSDGGGTNDRWLTIHLAPEHVNPRGLPKISGPHYGCINDLTTGLVSSVRRMYSAHTSDGKVYLEDYGTSDASQSYSSTTVPFIVKGGRIYDKWNLWGTTKASLRHTAWGAGVTCSVQWQTGRGSGGTTQTVTKTVSLVSAEGTDFLVGRAGEWAEVQITETAAGAGAIQDIRAVIQPMGQAGYGGGP